MTPLVPNKGDGLGQDPLAHMGLEREFGDHVDLGAEQVDQVHQQAAEVEQAPVGGEIDQEIDVARGFGIATND